MNQRRWFAALAVACLFLALPTGATFVKSMNLDALAGNADAIIQGKVLEVRESQLDVQGVSLPVHVVTFAVTDSFKGSGALQRRGGGIETRTMEMTMLAPFRAESPAFAKVHRIGMFAHLPQVREGGEYIVFKTANSVAGLSNFVGLGQGLFAIREIAGRRVAINEAGNAGLFEGMESSASASGIRLPVDVLTAEIRRSVNR